LFFLLIYSLKISIKILYMCWNFWYYYGQWATI